ncbi:MAG TPA: hypothetical protein VF451_07965 [Acidobacteriota bacterium]
MKRSTFWLVALLVGSMMAAGLSAAAGNDYQVIKNAVKKSQATPGVSKSLQWFKIVVTGKDGSGENVKITLPVSLVELMLNACPEKKFNVEKGCEIDIQRIWNDLKAAGPMALVEIEDHGETVKIWLE